MSKQKGFSLIELLIVVTVIMVISAIAVPNFLRSRLAANEASAVRGLRTIGTAETAYVASYGPNYSADLASLGGTSCTIPLSTAACLIDDGLAHATSPDTSRSGFYYTYAISSSVGYTLNSDPAYWNKTGSKHFYADASGVIRSTSANTPAVVTDPAVQ
ncbi:MAG: type II secretion system protein [Candidatus Korobacteraceae bacterium]|jgi:prepilin-type N-terminal cleavage/methylation domain-containing protein